MNLYGGFLAHPQGKHSKPSKLRAASKRPPKAVHESGRPQDRGHVLQAQGEPAGEAVPQLGLEPAFQATRTPKDPTGLFKPVDTILSGEAGVQTVASVDDVRIQTVLQTDGGDGLQSTERPFARGAQRMQDGAHSSSGDLPAGTGKSKRLRLKLAILISIGAIILIAVGVFAVYTINAHQHDKAKEQFNQGINLMQEADETVVALDTAVNEQVTTEKLESLQELIDSAPAADAKLDEANVVFDGITKELVNNDGINLLDEARTGVSARKEMLNLGRKLVAYDIAAMKSANALTEAWTAIVDADTRLRTALALMTSANIENATTAHNESTAAIADLDKAISKLDEASAALSGTDFTAIKEYAMAKREAITYAIASDEAYLAGNSEETKAQTNNYNQADVRVVALASALPEDPTKSILVVYEALTDTVRKQYLDARSRAASADAIVRDYLGINETMANDTGFGQVTGTT